MKNNWFRWEREASIHLLFPTLAVFYQPLKKYSGVSAPTMILVFEKGVVTWCIKEDEFIDYGNKLIEIYSHAGKEEKMVGDISNALDVLKTTEEEIEKIRLGDIANLGLINLHKRLYQAFINYYTMGAIGTPLSFSAELILKERGLSDEELNRLTTPDEISYITEADDYLLKTKNIKGFIRKYFWINNNYSATDVISAEAVKSRLKQLQSLHSTAVEQSDLTENKISLSDRDLRLVELLKNYSMYKDNRKKEILIYLHYLYSILEEIADRRNLSKEEIRACLPWEIEGIINSKVTKNDLQERLKYCVIVWQKNRKEPKILIGEKGKKWEQITLTKENSEVKFIKGNTACPGETIGKVRILLRVEDSHQMKKGEVLVTFMTSPDFMPAIRKASAIVTNLGGVTSHAAIISRELGIPCIVGTKIATQVLKDGDLVEVDANNGVVKILS